MRLRGVRRGVDAIFYHSERQLEYDLVLEPGARAGGLGVRFQGQRKLSLQDGDIVLDTDADQVRQRKPTAWQEIDGVRRPVAVEYALSRPGEVYFRLGDYDHSRPLRIDPVIVYATYLPANPTAMTVNSAGEVYLTGTVNSSSADFPVTAGAYDTTVNGSNDAFVMKLDASGSSVLLATYLGGSSDDSGYAIAQDAVGNIYVAGSTYSSNFPSTYDARTGTGYYTAFLTKLSAGGSALLYSVLLTESYNAKPVIAVDAAYSAYIAVQTTGFTTTAGAFRSTGAGGNDIGVAKLNPAGSALLYATFLGGSGDESLGDMTIDSSGAVYVTGSTLSSNFPTTAGAYRTTSSGNGDAFVAKLDPSASGASSLVFSTYLGGSSSDYGYAIAVDLSGNVYVGGQTSSSDFPTTPGAYSTTINSSYYYGDGFVTKLNPSGTGLVYSTYLGGPDSDQVLGIKIDALGSAILFGYSSSRFPTTPGSVMQYVGSSNAMFLTVLGPDGGSVTYSAVIGPTDSYSPRGSAYDGHSAYLLGTTSASAPTTAGSYHPTWSGVSGTGYLIKVDLDSPVSCTFSISPGIVDIPATGGPGWFDVTAPAGCAWSATSSSSQVTLTNPSALVGSGRIDFSVAPANAGAATQLYTITVSGATGTVRQAPGDCSAMVVTPSPVSFYAAGGLKNIQVVTPSNCGWRAAPTVGWLKVNSISGNTINLYAEPNSFGARSGSLLIGEGAVTVSQEGGSCSLTLSSTTASFAAAGGTGGIPFTTSSSYCSWSAWTNQNWIRIDSVSGAGSSALAFTVMANPGGLARAGTVYLDGRTVTVTQAPGTGATADAYWISTFAGNGSSGTAGDGGYATSASIYSPRDVACDQAGNLLIAENGGNRIRKVTSNGIITTLIGGGQDSTEGAPALLALLQYPVAVAVAPNGTVHFAEASRVRKLDADGKIYTVAGTGSSSGPVGDNGPATSATLISVSAMTFDSAGNLYIADSQGNRVRRVDPSGTITTVAGTGTAGFSGDGDLATAATLRAPYGVLADTQGNLYISDSTNHRIRKVGTDHKINTIAGTGTASFTGDTGSAALATLNYPRGMAWDTAGNLVFLDYGNNRIRRIDSLGVINTIAGNGSTSSSGDDGPALNAGFYYPQAVAADNVGNLYVPENCSYRVRKLAPARFCTFTVTPLTVSPFAATGGPLSFTVTPDAPSCAWNASSTAGWLTIDSGSSESGNGTVGVSVATNFGGPPRTGTLTVAGRVLTVTQIAGGGALRFVPITPCRVVDTRNSDGPFGGPAIAANTSRDFDVPAGSCGIPSNALAYSFNVTAVPSASLLYLSMWPTGQPLPVVSTLNALDGRWTANAAIVPAGTNGSVSVFASDATHVVLDINGYFVPAATSGALAFYPLTPCRVIDTRGGTSIAAGGTRTVPVHSSSCNVPSGAVAYSLNFTALPHGPLGWITTWPTGQAMPTASTLNAPTGTITANAAILPAGASPTSAV